VEDGGILDDCIVYRLADARYLFVPNASNAEAVGDWLYRWASGGDVQIVDITYQWSMLALQGPKSASMLGNLTQTDLSTLKPFNIVQAEVAGSPALVARTGYTGEDGFEIMFPQEHSRALWKGLVDGGAKPCGLGARDVLRLEAGLLLHGNDMDLSVNPYEAGLDRFVDPDRDGYIPGATLRSIRDAGPDRVLVGFNIIGRGIARHGYPITDGSKQIGEVSSGSVSPTLDRNIGLGYVPTGFSAPGSRFDIDIRGRGVAAEVTPLPFYSRKKT
jgi:aminomethyltransferase